ncbi:Myb-like DNA-binding domain-containing protein [Spironucleus salmonicida]|uniref:Myb-like DNA-binding domain-containing protein n=1 Tax=Spironucleus salmonicida TaxID=348837 RepID=V6LG17_9EUKA|nr:Myb-like DNA-binding domain-containing protein [Spironucleus salmonicida]|eukprot:EST43500.1 Myb-like DNA-binding domain-containing protein [Spironucleus salmonicida]
MKRQYQKWSYEEQQKLLLLLEQHTQHSKKVCWSLISDQIKTKTQRQCFDFYTTRVKENCVLNNRHKWSDEEKQELLRLANQGDWSTIQSRFYYLSISQIKNKISHIQSQVCKKIYDTDNLSLVVFESPEFVYFEN